VGPEPPTGRGTFKGGHNLDHDLVVLRTRQRSVTGLSLSPHHEHGHQCYGSCTGCQSVSALCSRSRCSYISRLLERLPRTSQTTVAFCRTLVVTHCGPIPMTWKLLMTRTHNKLGGRSFSAASPRLWNDLSPGLRRPGLTFDSFRQSLKSHLFGNRSA